MHDVNAEDTATHSSLSLSVSSDFLTKGSQVTVTGQAYIETYEAKTGETRANLNVAVNDFSLPPKPRVESGEMPF